MDMEIVQQADERWHQVMARVGREETKRFESNPDGYINSLIELKSVRLLMRWIYHHMVSKKKVIAIEKYPLKQKQEIWDFVLEKCKSKCQNKTTLIEIAKIFCLIDYYINENSKST